ncbi:MAG: FtsQ-type POTRA domain-containing protein [Acidobacteria bacterium]|nr:FtsQ-type POTRA domain-containing protein [Acidobacteriota bacterium]
MPKKKKTVSRSRASSVRVKGSRSRSGNTPRLGKYVLPLILLSLLAGGLIFMGFSGFQSATASSFFSLRSVEIRGVERTPKDDIAKLVTSSVEKPGVWNADLADLKAKIEKFPFVKSASVSRNLPTGIRVNVIERVPAAVVKLSSGNFLVDTEGVVLVPVKASEKDFPIVLHGWDEAKTEKAGPDNLARLKIYKKMLDESKQFDVTARVKEFNLANLREPVAVVEDSGRTINVSLARDSLGKSLKTAIEALTGKGTRIKSVDSGGVHPIIQYLDF